nr:diguanylate cyclase [uncultured Lichenicoccus sp.]
MSRLDITMTPANYEVWLEYHLHRSPELTRVIDIMISNRLQFDDAVLKDLHDRFFSTAREEQALRSTSSRIQETLREIVSVVTNGQTDTSRFGRVLHETWTGLELGEAAFGPLLKRFIEQTEEMVTRTDRLSGRLKNSAQAIETLEQTLLNARREAATDGLTGLQNRRAFDVLLREQAGAAMNSGEDLTLLLLDVDHFKKVNDRWGHQKGDEVLCLVATTLRAAVHDAAFPARYGGEEFAIIVPNTRPDAAAALAERVRRSIEAQSFTVPTAPESLEGVTISIGGSCYEPGEPLAEWLQRADSALYAAKQEGRNRVIMT